jgi:hypothetical protein
MQLKRTPPARVPDSVPDCQPISRNEIITFSWPHNAEVSITMLSGDSIHLAPEKFKTVVNVKERLKWSAFIEQTVAHRMILCLPWFGGELIVTRTRPVLDHLAKLGFGA